MSIGNVIVQKFEPTMLNEQENSSLPDSNNLNVEDVHMRVHRRNFEFGMTHVVRPRGRHLATIVWLHGLGDKDQAHLSSWSHFLFQILSGYVLQLPLVPCNYLVDMSYSSHSSRATTWWIPLHSMV